MAKGKIRSTDKVIKDALKILKSGPKNDVQLRKMLAIGPGRLKEILKYMKAERMISRRKVGNENMNSLVRR